MIAIIGASGFIGNNLISYLEEFGQTTKSVSLRNSHWQDNIDNVDIIIDLVGKAHDHKGTATKEDYEYVNITLTKKIFYGFLESKAKLMIYVSSIAAVEEFETLSHISEEEPCRPISLYGVSKRDAEVWLLSQSVPPGKKVIILRPPMVHGAGDKGSLGLLYKVISKGIPYPLASFDNKRSFISIENFSFFIHQIVLNSEKLNSGIYHIADDESISTKEIIEIIKNVTGKKVRDMSLPKSFVKTIAKIGDFIPIPLNSKRLKKMTGNLLVSNAMIKDKLSVKNLPLTAREGLERTIKEFQQGRL